MKITKKIFSVTTILLGVFLTVLGLILYACGIGTSNVNGESFTKELQIDTLSEVSITSETGNITIKNGDKFKLECENAIENNLEYSFENGKLVIKYKFSKILKCIQFEPFTNNISKSKITVTLPQSELENVSLKNGAGVMNVSDLSCEKLSLKSGLGECDLRNCTFSESLICKNGVGQINAKGCEIGRLELSNGVGESNFDDCKLGGNTTIDNGIGEVNLTLDTFGYLYNIEQKSGIGQIKISDNSDKSVTGDAEFTMEISNGIGEVNVEFTGK